MPLLSYLGITYIRNEFVSDVIQWFEDSIDFLNYGNAGTTLVIDEMYTKIHLILLRRVVVLYNNIEINKNDEQLIFTSYNLATMNNDIFCRDEIWFVAKGRERNSKLYSLVEFKNKKGESVRMNAKY